MTDVKNKVLVDGDEIQERTDESTHDHQDRTIEDDETLVGFSVLIAVIGADEGK